MPSSQTLLDWGYSPKDGFGRAIKVAEAVRAHGGGEAVIRAAAEAALPPRPPSRAVDHRNVGSIFFWAKIEPSWTVPGFLRFRRGDAREGWGRVLAGTDEQIGEAFASLVLPFRRHLDLDEEMVLPFVALLVMRGRLDDLAGFVADAHDGKATDLRIQSGLFAEGWRAARGTSRAAAWQSWRR